MSGHAGESVVTGVKAAILAALTLDGFLCALGAVLFLPAYLGSTPFPVSGLIAGAANVLLVRVAYSVSHDGGRAALPVGGFALGLLLAMLGGPGGDVLVLADWRLLVLLAGGVLPPVVQLFALRFRRLTALGAR